VTTVTTDSSGYAYKVISQDEFRNGMDTVYAYGGYDSPLAEVWYGNAYSDHTMHLGYNSAVTKLIATEVGVPPGHVACEPFEVLPFYILSTSNYTSRPSWMTVGTSNPTGATVGTGPGYNEYSREVSYVKSGQMLRTLSLPLNDSSISMPSSTRGSYAVQRIIDPSTVDSKRQA
jgi:hypothetical protein